MISKAKKSNLLCLRGVFLRDLETTITSVVVPEPEQPQTLYTEIPKRFVGVSTWPIACNLRCWECSQVCHSYPTFIPTNFTADECDVYGVFDHWNCAVRHAQKEFPASRVWDTLKAICLFESKFSGRLRQKIMPAPSKVLMIEYCGKGGLTPKQFNDKIAILNADYEMLYYKLDHFTTEK